MEISDYEMPEPQPSEALRDAVEESWRRSEHEGKVAHIRQDDAEAAAALLRWEHPDTNFNAYLCHFGHHWHVGRNRTAEERLERKAEALEEAKMKLRMAPPQSKLAPLPAQRIPAPEDVRDYLHSHSNKRDKAADEAGVGITFLERSLHGEVRAADWRSENLARAVEARRWMWEGKKDVVAVTAVFAKQEYWERQAAAAAAAADSDSLWLLQEAASENVVKETWGKGEPPMEVAATATSVSVEALAPDFWDVPLQVCSRCGISYPHTAEFFQRTAARDHHLHTMCRNCNKEMGRTGRGEAPKSTAAVAPPSVTKASESAPSASEEQILKGLSMAFSLGDIRTALQLAVESVDRCEAEMGRMAAENLALINKLKKWEAAWDTLAGLRVRP